MDEQVKARLIGATVLVVIAVLLVPELLSGPKNEAGDDAAAAGKRGTRTFTIDLGGAVGAGSRIQPGPASTAATEAQRPPSKLPAPPGAEAKPRPSAPASAPAAKPEPAATPESATVRQSAPAPAAKVATAAEPPQSTGSAPVQEASPTPVAQPKPVPAAKGAWAVQVGAFGSVDTARKLVADLGRDGLPAYVAPLKRNGKNLYRVRVGPVATKADAQQLARRLEARRLPAAVVAAD